MAVPRWFEATFLEAQDAGRPVDFVHLGEQFGLRIEEVVPTRSLNEWWTRAQAWTDSSKLSDGSLSDTDREILTFLEQQSPDVMGQIPQDKQPEFLSGLWKKKN